jgi:hypothetical protein
VGGILRAGELHLGRFGVLMLDELPEFGRQAIHRLGCAIRGMHGAPLIVATALDCPCGASARTWTCKCTDGARARFTKRTMDSMAALALPYITMRMQPVSRKALRNQSRCESTETWRKRLWGV